MPTSPGVRSLELVHVRLPLRRPFVSRHGARARKDALLVRIETADGVVGWGECVAEPEPTYAPEYLGGVWMVVRDHLAPRLVRGEAFDGIAGNHMAKAAVEMAVLDAKLRTDGHSLWSWLGGTRARIPVGVVVERYDDPATAADVATAHIAEGYRRIKLKIAPGADRAYVDAVRSAVGAGIALWADANGGYTVDDADLLCSLDVDLLEQPLRAGDLLDHAELRRRMAGRMAICLDESITSVEDTRLALHVGAADAITLKAGRLGGLAKARAAHDLCARAEMPVWCGGMLETGIGRAANLALASLPGFTLPGDLSASRRYFDRDLTAPFELGEDGCIAVPDGPGLGVTVDEDYVAAMTLQRERITDG